MIETALQNEQTRTIEDKDNVIPFPKDTYTEEKNELQTSYSSLNREIDSIFPEQVLHDSSNKSKQARRIIRTTFTKKMFVSLKWLSDNHEMSDTDSIPYMQQFFEILKKYYEGHFEDPYSSFLTALYDALAYNDAWINLKKDDFKSIGNLMKGLNNQPNLDYDKIDKAINKLEKLGLDTTPF
jgi:hypothetical protein